MMARIIKLITGLLLYAVGIVFTINVHLGLSPWDVLHQGLSRETGITMGQASIYVGLAILVLNFAFKEKIGYGTILNMYLIGWFLDFLMINKIIPEPSGMPMKFIMLACGMLIIGLASYLYIGAGLGAGPRDGLMLALYHKTGKSIRFVRNSIEITVFIAGFFLGGTVGLGTVILSLGIGPVIQLVFKLFKFDVKSVHHLYIDDHIRSLFSKDRKAKNEE